MWSSTVATRLLDYYTDFYAVRERAKYAFNLEGLLIGGSAGLRLLLDNRINPTDSIEIYSQNPLKKAREIATQFYLDTKRTYVFARTLIEDRTFEVLDGTRTITTVVHEGTTNLMPIPYKYKDYNCFLVAPNLQLIKVLADYSDPSKFDDRNDNRELIRRLVDKLREMNPEIIADNNVSYLTAPLVLKKVSGSAREILLNSLFVVATSNYCIFVIKDDIHEFAETQAKNFGTNIKLLQVMLPNEFFLYKVIVRSETKGSYKFIFYNESFYNILGYKNINGIRQAIPSVVMRYMLIEDNASMSLFKRGLADFASRIYNPDIYEKVINEEFPEVSSFYGFSRNKDIMRRDLQKQGRKHPEFFPITQKELNT